MRGGVEAVIRQVVAGFSNDLDFPIMNYVKLKCPSLQEYAGGLTSCWTSSLYLSSRPGSGEESGWVTANSYPLDSTGRA